MKFILERIDALFIILLIITAIVFIAAAINCKPMLKTKVCKKSIPIKTVCFKQDGSEMYSCVKYKCLHWKEKVDD